MNDIIRFYRISYMDIGMPGGTFIIFFPIFINRKEKKGVVEFSSKLSGKKQYFIVFISILAILLLI
jgi:hypothetical protein